MNRSKGFGLLELMIVLVIASLARIFHECGLLAMKIADDSNG